MTLDGISEYHPMPSVTITLPAISEYDAMYQRSTLVDAQTYLALAIRLYSCCRCFLGHSGATMCREVKLCVER